MFISLIESCPDEVLVERLGNTTQVLVAVAESTHSARTVFIDSSLTEVENRSTLPNATLFAEFAFSITVIDLDGVEAPFSTQDRWIARNYLPTQVRALVIPIVLKSLDAMIRATQPKTLYRVAKQRGMPLKAMEKHHRITAALEQHGYQMFETGLDPWHRPYWLMKLRG